MKTVRMTNPQALPQMPGSQEYTQTQIPSTPTPHTMYDQDAHKIQGGRTVSEYKEKDENIAVMSSGLPATHCNKQMDQALPSPARKFGHTIIFWSTKKTHHKLTTPSMSYKPTPAMTSFNAC